MRESRSSRWVRRRPRAMAGEGTRVSVSRRASWSRSVRLAHSVGDGKERVVELGKRRRGTEDLVSTSALFGEIVNKEGLAFKEESCSQELWGRNEVRDEARGGSELV